MRLIYHPLSSNSRRVLLTAHHLELDLELVVVDLSSGEHKSAEYLRLNPNGRIPILVDDGLELWESHAIMQYLADKSPHRDIYPKHLAARADVNRWLVGQSFRAGRRLSHSGTDIEKILGGSHAIDLAEIARGEALLPAAARVLDHHLAGKQWIAQGRLTLVDFAIAAPLMHTEAAQLPVTQFENLQAWFARVRSLDAWAKSSA